MAYTNSWTNNVPAGSAQASSIDDQIRRLRLDIQERMDTILDPSGSWLTGDPIILLTSGIGVITARHVIIPGHQCQPVTPKDDDVRYEYSGLGYFEAQGSINPGLTTVCPVRLPIGVTIKRLEAMIRNGAGNFSAALYYVPFTVPAATNLVATVSTSSVGTDLILDSGALNHTVGDGNYHIVNSDPSVFGAYRIYAYRLTIDIPGVGSMV